MECLSTGNGLLNNLCTSCESSPFYFFQTTDEFIWGLFTQTGNFFKNIGDPSNYPSYVSANFTHAPTEKNISATPDSSQDTAENITQPQQPQVSVPVEKTISATSGNVNVSNGITIKNQTSYSVDTGSISEQGIPFSIQNSDVPQVLILHTHGTESYTPSEKYNFTYTTNTRTTDPEYNVVRIGRELAQELKNKGIVVVHDTTQYDYPDYNSSYDKAYYGIQAMLRKYPSIQIVIDLHRDAVNTDTGETVKLIGDVKGEKAAQIMFVVGTDECGFSHPHWEFNLKFASMIQSELYNISPSLVRPINLRTSRFNQHFTKGSLIVEVGTNGNTLDEALVSAKYLAQAIKLTVEKMK